MARNQPAAGTDGVRMKTIAWFAFSQDYGVLELQETCTGPGSALELHVIWSKSEGLVAWWCMAAGKQLGFAQVGRA